MKIAHLVKISVFSYEKDDRQLILRKFMQLFPFNLRHEKIKLKTLNAEGFGGKNIVIYEAALTKEKHINNFISNLVKNIGDEQKKLILSQLETRLDKNLDFFLRFDKDRYLKNNKLEFTDSGNCFHIKVSIAAFPKKREIGLDIIKRVLIYGL